MGNNINVKPGLVPFNEAARRLNRSRSKLYDELDPHSKKFNSRLPRPVHDAGRTGFFEEEIDAYLIELKRIRDASDPYIRTLSHRGGGDADR